MPLTGLNVNCVLNQSNISKTKLDSLHDLGSRDIFDQNNFYLSKESTVHIKLSYWIVGCIHVCFVLAIFRARFNKGLVTSYNISPIFSESTYPRRLWLYSKFKFCNYVTLKIGLLSENFSYGPWEAFKVGRVAQFLFGFCLEIDYNSTFTKRRLSFLVELKI